jgi:chromatin structure-remodeling complex subunit RSC1/2
MVESAPASPAKTEDVPDKGFSDLVKPIFDGIYKLRSPVDDHDVSYVFQTLPDRRLTTYYKIIKRPFSLYMIKQNLSQHKYSSVSQFIVDVAQITYNARFFNSKRSHIYEDAVIIDNYLKEQIEGLRATSRFSNKDLAYPIIGPLPEGSEEEKEEEPVVAEDEDDDDDDDDDDDEDDEDDDEDDENGRRSSLRAKSRRSVVTVRRKRKEEEEEDQRTTISTNNNTSVMDDRRKRRGRPPTVDKPHEHRIKAILRGIRKEREPHTGRHLYVAFEKLPDPKRYPQYYQEVTDPIALDIIRKNIKRRQYTSVEECLADMNLLFNNAKRFNANGTQIYNDAAALQGTMNRLAEEELKKPDSVYQDPDSNSKTARMPLDQVQHRGEIYTVGDWVHLSNMNDPAKPTIGQIFRIWQAADGEKWVNCCWYYRPEQTVHRYDRLFYENEVVKSGQYRDHLVDEILEKCFVMFFTKYQRGRPSGIGDRQVYCCESRYNETDKVFNKIRTWKACIPDEVRSVDYPMDVFEKQIPLRKVASPIKHLLSVNARDDDPIPDPKMGVPNAPPIVGAVYKRPYDPADPPEQPTPEGADGDHMRPVLTPTAPRVQRRGTSTYVPKADTPKLPYQQQTRMAFTPSVTAPPSQSVPPRPVQYPNGQSYMPPAPPSTFTLPEGVQAKLSTRHLGAVSKLNGEQIVWFTAPPVWIPRRHVCEPIRKDIRFTVKRAREEDDEEKIPMKGVGHSARYLAWRLQKDAAGN